MGLFDFLKIKKNDNKKEEKIAKKVEISEDEARMNKIWDLWPDKIPSPTSELMTYQAEVNNGGHDQFFFNLENGGRLEETMTQLRSLLKGGRLENLERAYVAYQNYDENEDYAQEVMEECDEIYYDHEDEINQLLEKLWADIEV
jgi:hypothetical protein